MRKKQSQYGGYKMDFNVYLPIRVLFGAGRLNGLHTQSLPGHKAMVVISDGKSARANGALTRTEEQLHMAGVETVLFDKVGANPLKTVVEEGAAFARTNACDFVVALGGGSVMAARRAMGLCGGCNRKKQAPCPRPPTGRCDYHHSRDRIGSRPMGCCHQAGNP